MAIRYIPEWVDQNLPEDFDPSDLSPYRALEKHADYVAEQIENPPLILIDLDRDSLENIREKLQPPAEPRGRGCCGSSE
ncbi:MAG: hypothetical protein HYZ81_21980 [Nitrospinae bacterium]|nr:hypothetical protein [Nitrospinota bacterium]